MCVLQCHSSGAITIPAACWVIKREHWYAVCMVALWLTCSNHGGWCWLAHVIIKLLAMWVNLCWWQRKQYVLWVHCYCVCVTQSQIDGRTGTEREGERIDECRHSGRAGERWRALFFSLSLFSQCREVTSSSAIWRECHATLPLPLPQTQMKFYFLVPCCREKTILCLLD